MCSVKNFLISHNLEAMRQKWINPFVSKFSWILIIVYYFKIDLSIIRKNESGWNQNKK